MNKYTAWFLTQAVYRQATRNFHRGWQYHMLLVYNCILLTMSTWGSKQVEENSILWINTQFEFSLKLWTDRPPGTHILLKMSTWGSKHVEENSILWINNNQYVTLLINIKSIHDARSEKHHVIQQLINTIRKLSQM